ncbi:hypothetical protein EHQ47_16745 [Leptospira bourretii]|uniref:nucleotide-binding protein n=1 Tax=Leptospira bourretii TaxID=2484962 RepID=UPI0010914AF9|nr:nucleotide-binding protein [Leptospira bourretii]TGL19744.1 hypothetical protein EHQ47_16745 [Leptospira bourretii]
MLKPRLFIGSSVEGLSVAYAIQENLKFVAETTVWDQGMFNLSESTLESLLTILDTCDFGTFVFSPDDYIKIRGKKDLAVRDNVLFELGLFIGRLGRKRCFVIIPDNREFHLPTDLIGVTPAKYEASRSDNNLQAGTGSASHKLRDSILKLGVIEKTKQEPETKNQIDTQDKNKIENWIELLHIKKDYDAAITELKKKIRYEKDQDSKIQLKGSLCYAEYQKNTVKGSQEYEKLISDNKTNNISYYSYARTLYWSNSFSKALKIIDEGLLNCERKINLTLLKADCLWETNQQDQTLQLLEKSLEQMNDPEIYIKLSTFLSKIDKKKEAIKNIFKAFNEFPKNENILYEFAKLSYDLNHKDLTILLYKELLSTYKNNSTYHCLLGNAYLDLGFYNLALESYEKANELTKGGEGWILANIGNLYYNKSLYDLSEKFLILSQNIDKKSDYTHNKLGIVYKAKQAEMTKLLEILKTAKSKASGEILNDLSL